MTQSGICKLGDFGCSRTLSEAVIEQIFHLVRTPLYLAPEVLKQHADALLKPTIIKKI